MTDFDKTPSPARAPVDISALPSARRRTFLPLLFVHVGQSMLAAIIAWSLTLAGVTLLRLGSDVIQGLTYLSIVALLLAFELGLALYLVVRRRKFVRLTTLARRALITGESAEARLALMLLLNFLEHRVDPRSVYYGLALADVMDDEHDRALELLKKCGNHPAALELRAILLLHRGLGERAQRLITRALALRPRNARLWVTLAACYQARGDEAMAAEILSQASQKWPRLRQIRDARSRLESGEYLPDSLLTPPV